MNLHARLRERAAQGRPVRVGLIGAGKFGSMFLAQACRTAGVQVVGLADLSTERMRDALMRADWPADSVHPAQTSGAINDVAAAGHVALTESAEALIGADLDVIVEATGSPEAGTCHALAAIDAGRHVVMVTVEADVLVGPLLRQRADQAGVIYSLAYGDQPALICELVDWARACGFEVVAAGKGTKYLPEYHDSTPETVFAHYGLSAEQARQGGLNAKMFNSFLDGTKSAIEMAAVANATGLIPQPTGLRFPPVGVQRLADVLKPKSDGGILAHSGTVEVVSSLHRDGSPVPGDLRWGVYVIFRTSSEYVEQCFAEYGILRDRSGRYAALYRPNHFIGLELGISVASVALRHEPTGAPSSFVADVVACAKKDLTAGEMLDGEGGYTVFGKLMTARESLACRALPAGLASEAKLLRPVARGQVLRYDDVKLLGHGTAARLRCELEASFA
jgi:predicted homoserine dehydrogenase-like protein